MPASANFYLDDGSAISKDKTLELAEHEIGESPTIQRVWLENSGDTWLHGLIVELDGENREHFRLARNLVEEDSWDVFAAPGEPIRISELPLPPGGRVAFWLSSYFSLDDHEAFYRAKLRVRAKSAPA